MADIIELLERRDERALQLLREHYGDYCHAIVIRLLGDEREAEEVLSDVWLSVWNAIPPARPGHLKAYLAKTARNTAINRIRRDSAAKRSGATVVMEELAECIPDRGWEDRIRSGEIREAMNGFLAKLTDYWDLQIEWLDGWDLESFRVEDGKVPCLVRRELYGSVGGVVAASPTAWYGEINPQAPTFELVVAGVVSDTVGRIGERDLLVPEESFLGEAKLFYNSDLMYRCYYRAYAMELDPAYNREYDRVEQELEKKLYDLSAYSFATNAHALENAARPLIQKLQMQELLVTPLCVLLCLAAVVIAVLLGMSFELEVFLRLMWGEKRAKVFVTLSGAVLMWLVICVIASVGAGFVMPVWAAKFSGVTAGLSMAGCAVPLGIRCGGNLIRSYQSREGE